MGIKEQIIAQSRRKYARPRAKVEKIIAMQMGWDSSAAKDKAKTMTKVKRNIR